MVDVSAKAPSLRTATASGLVRMASETLALIVDRKLSESFIGLLFDFAWLATTSYICVKPNFLL